MIAAGARSAFAAIVVAAAAIFGWGATPAAGAAPAAGATAVAPQVTPETTLADCEAWARRAPRDLGAYDCFERVARRLRLLDEAVQRVDALLALEPDNHWARFGLALLEWDRRAPRARDLAIAAADGFAASGDKSAESRARMSISISFQTVDEARALLELERAETLAIEIGDPLLRAYVALNRAQAAQRRQDYGAALQAYDDAERLIDPHGDPKVARQGETIAGMILSGRGAVAWRTGRMREALEDYQREAALYQRTGRPFEASGVLYNIALTSADLNRAEGAPPLDEVRRRYAAALDAARAIGNHTAEANLLVMGAQFLPPAEAAVEARRAAELLRNTPWSSNALFADWLLAEALDRGGTGDPREPMRLRESALARALARGDRLEIASAWRFLGEGLWRRGREDEAFAAWDKSSDAYETLRRSQPEAETRRGVFERSSAYLPTLVDRCLTRWTGRGDPADLERAFGALERGQARGLLDALEAGGAGTAADLPERAERDQVLQAIAATQGRLEDPGLDPASRRAALAELEGLEAREALLRDAIARADPEWGAMRQPLFPALAEVRAALDDGEVLLIYQAGMPGRPGDSLLESEAGGSWVLAIARDGVRAAPLPPRDDLERQVNLILGAIARGDGSDDALARLLGGTLVGAILPGGGATLRRLVVVPDGVLHHLPFEALRPWPDGAPLGESLEVVRAPSAAAWYRWRRETGGATPGSALVVADPALRSEAEGANQRTEAANRLVVPWYEGLRAGPLPYARREGEQVGRLFGARARILLGDDATEGAVKRALDGGIGFLHIAAHAVVDELRPRRSAIVLAPGADGEDGLLQPHEIGPLRLRGATVVLSACSSASGAIQGGEGVNGLAAAFLRAGARAVIGGLWTLRDADTAAFVGTFTAVIGQGETAAGALRDARRTLIRRGAPTSAWAGLVLIGDGDVRPLPPRAAGPFTGVGAATPAGAAAEAPGSRSGGRAAGLRIAALFAAALALVALHLRGMRTTA